MSGMDFIFLNGVCTLGDLIKTISHKTVPMSGQPSLVVEAMHLMTAVVLNLKPWPRG